MSQSNAIAAVDQDEGIRQLSTVPALPTAQRLALALPTMEELKVLQAYGEMFAKSGLFPQVQSWQAAAAIIQYGSQLGIDAFTALKDIYWIKGKPTCDASLINSLIKRDHGGEALMPVEATTERCTIRFKRREWDHYEELTVSADQYQHLIADSTRVTWKTNRQDMLWARCVSTIGRRHFSDTIKGLYTREEMADAAATEAAYRVIPVNRDPPAGSAIPPGDEPGDDTSGAAVEAADAAEAPPQPKPDPARAVTAKRLYATIRDKFGKDQDASAIGHDLVCTRFGLTSTKEATTEQLREAIGAVEGWAPERAPHAMKWLGIVAKAVTPTMVEDIRLMMEDQGVEDPYLVAALKVAQGRYPIPEDVFAASGRAVDDAMVP